MSRWSLIVLLAAVTAAAETVNPEKYRIENGDNLSTISGTLFGDPAYWPKIWKNNSKSHLVENGHSIQMLLGSDEAAPAFAVSEAEDETPVESSAIRQVAVLTKNNEVEIPPPRNKSVPVLSLGGIFPPWQGVKPRQSSFKNPDIQVDPRNSVNFDTKMVLPVYVQDEEIHSVGEYVIDSEEFHLVADGKEIFVRLKPGSGQIGAHFMMLSDDGALRQTVFVENLKGVTYGGHIVSVLAEISLIEAVPSTDSGWDYFRARVEKTVGLSLVGASIVAGRVTTVSVNKNGPKSNVHAEVIGGNFDNKSAVFGEGSWVFLNRGGKDGLQAGQLVWVTSNIQARNSGLPFVAGVRKSALVKVAKVASEVSTGLVLASSETVTQGDWVGSVQEAAPVASPDKMSDPDDSSAPPGDESGIDTGVDENK